MLDQNTTIALVFRIVSVGALLSSTELIKQRSNLKADGLMSWDLGRLRTPWLVRGSLGKCFNLLLSYPNVVVLLVFRAVLSAFIILAPTRLVLSPWTILPSTALCWLIVLRTGYGQDGADQMAYIIYSALSLATLAGVRQAGGAFLWFIALQACLSYLVAGVAKASAQGWRDGTYLLGIAQTQIYGNMDVARFLCGRPRLTRVIGLGVIAWECCFVSVLLVPKPVALSLLASGVLFHLANGYLMGLNTFIWSFTSTYPAILFCVLR